MNIPFWRNTQKKLAGKRRAESLQQQQIPYLFEEALNLELASILQAEKVNKRPASNKQKPLNRSQHLPSPYKRLIERIKQKITAREQLDN